MIFLSTYYTILIELNKLEHWSTEFHDELLLLSKFIRNKIWNRTPDNVLNKILQAMNTYLIFDCSMDAIDAYIDTLEKVVGKYFGNSISFNEMHQEIQIISAGHLIEKQWEKIYEPVGAAASFMKVFDKFYTDSIENYSTIYFALSLQKAYTYRACADVSTDAQRFIPWTNKSQNRWNPPGKTYLYLSYGEEDTIEPEKDYSINQHTCMEELRGKPGDVFSICKFIVKPNLKVLDLSYNDIAFHSLEKPVNTAYEKVSTYMEQEWMPSALQDQKIILAYQKDPEAFSNMLKEEIKKDSEKANLLESVHASYGRQYLKLICDAVFKPIEDDKDAEEQYKSFHSLAEYLEKRKIDGIIYPSTRMALKGYKAKNLVLFDIGNAEPIGKSIVTVKL